MPTLLTRKGSTTDISLMVNFRVCVLKDSKLMESFGHEFLGISIPAQGGLSYGQIKEPRLHFVGWT